MHRSRGRKWSSARRSTGCRHQILSSSASDSRRISETQVSIMQTVHSSFNATYWHPGNRQGEKLLISGYSTEATAKTGDVSCYDVKSNSARITCPALYTCLESPVSQVSTRCSFLPFPQPHLPVIQPSRTILDGEAE